MAEQLETPWERVLNTALYRALQLNVIEMEELVTALGGPQLVLNHFGGPLPFIRLAFLGELQTDSLVELLPGKRLYALLFQRDWREDADHRALMQSVLAAMIQEGVLDDERGHTATNILWAVGPEAAAGFDAETLDVTELVESVPLSSLMRALHLFAYRHAWITRHEAQLRPSILPPAAPVKPPPLPPKRPGPPPLPGSKAEPLTLDLDVDGDLAEVVPEGPDVVISDEGETEVPAPPPVLPMVEATLVALNSLNNGHPAP